MTLAKGAEWCIIDFSQGKGVILTRIPILDSEIDLSWKRAAQVHSITTGFLFQVKRKMKPHLFLVHLGNQTGIFNLNWRLTEISDHQTRFGDQTSHMIGRQNPSNEPGRRSLVTKIYVEMRKKKREKKASVVNTSTTTTTTTTTRVLTCDKSVVILSLDPLTNQTNSLEAEGSSHVNKTLWLGCKQCSLHLKDKLRRHPRWQ